jgi:ABC-type sugar transport system substrate-binding protein
MTTKSVDRALAAGPWARRDRRFPAARLAAVALLLTVLAGCGTASPAGSEPGDGAKSVSKEIIAIFYTRTLEYYETMVTAMKDAAAKRGYSITAQYANFDITQQVEMVRVDR